MSELLDTVSDVLWSPSCRLVSQATGMLTLNLFTSVMALCLHAFKAQERTVSIHAGQSHDVKVASKCFETVAKHIYLRTILTVQNCNKI
jgi:hypothetical protein